MSLFRGTVRSTDLILLYITCRKPDWNPQLKALATKCMRRKAPVSAIIVEIRYVILPISSFIRTVIAVYFSTSGLNLHMYMF